MLDLTESALNAVRKVLGGDDGAAGLRIMVSAGGCSGFQYQMGLEAAPNEGDEVLEFDDVKVFVDASSQPLLDGVQVDFVESLTGSGFVFNNPNAQAKCGCGKSFSC